MKLTGMFVGNNLGKVHAGFRRPCGPTTLSFPLASLCRRGAGESEKLKIRCGRAYN